MCPSVDYARGLTQVGETTYAFLQPDGGWGWSNAGLILGAQEAVLVDTFFDLPKTQELLESVRTVTDRPIRTLVNTHHNGDHCWGNQLVEGATVVGHHACRTELLAGTAPSLLAGLAQAGEENGAAGYLSRAFAPFDFGGITLVPPTVTFEDKLSLHLGESEVRLEYFGPCHTLGDIVAWVPYDRVLYAGDLAFIGSTPLVWEGSLVNWIETVESLLAFDPVAVVPGHGPITDAAGLRAMQAYLEHVVSEGSKLKERGLSPIEAAQEINIGSFVEWKDSERLVLNLMRLWLELDGKPATERIDPFEAFGAMAELAKERAT
jgi:glyoxylase-like metal-dependent hydrolase (beta-lactamase superfamily II)